MPANQEDIRAAFRQPGREVHRRALKVLMPWHKRTFDIGFSALMIVLLSPMLLVLAVAVKITSKGQIFHWSKRVGSNNQLFLMPKFRSMQENAPQLATHLLTDPSAHLTPIGSFLRRTSLDELPQLFSILAGDMSFVGPRPALFNQDDLIALRTKRGVHVLVPGLTGLAQINGRDELPIPIKVEFDCEYLQRQSIWLDFEIIAITVSKTLLREGVMH